MQSGAGEPLVADPALLENRSAELVSPLREVDRARHYPGNLAALRLTKEMYRGARALSAHERNDPGGGPRRRV